MTREVKWRDLAPGLSHCPPTGEVYVNAEELLSALGLDTTEGYVATLATAAQMAVEWALEVGLYPAGDIVPALRLLLLGGPGPDWQPGPQDVYCVRVGKLYPKGGAGELVSIPQRFSTWKSHGFNWGYAGSGPHALAIEVLSLWHPPSKSAVEGPFWPGANVSLPAWNWSQAFKFRFVASMAERGGVILRSAVEQWIGLQGECPAEW